MTIALAAQASLAAGGDEIPQYAEIKARLASGWNTWNTRSVTSHVLLPECLSVNLAFKQVYWLDGKYLREPLIGRWDEGAEQIRPGPHALDGSYTELEIRWEQLAARVQTARDGNDLVILVTPLEKADLPVRMVIEAGILWNRPGKLSLEGGVLIAGLPGRSIAVHCTAQALDDPFVPSLTPHLVVPLDGPVGISTGTRRSPAEIESIITARKVELYERAAEYGGLSEAWLAIQSALAWNTIYDPQNERVLTTVGRLWNEERGGWCLFGWDNFMLSYMLSLFSRDLALANVIEHVRGRTEEGFIPNDNQANGRKSWDRSQPPVGGIMVREVYRRFPERWFLEEVFDGLLEWNRWWPRRRLNDGLLSYGSHPAKNPFNEPHVHTAVTALYESGMDDSPMYDGVPFNPEKNVIELQDVGLNSLYIADCRALAGLADVLGREEVAAELRARAQRFAKEMERLWDEPTGLYLNRRTDTGGLSRRISPTVFYPLLAGVPDQARARRIIEEHFFNPEEFWGEWILPSIARSDPDFPRQRYWKGSIWPPLNFLTYLSLRNYGFERACRELSERSLKLLINEWRRKGYVSENYSSITGTGDDARLSSDPFHSWGALFGFISFVEEGFMTKTESGIK